MRTQRWFWSGISLVCILAMFATSCGGGTTGVPGPGPIDPPIGGNQFPTSTSPDGPQALPILGASNGAPLGTTPEYNMQLLPNSPIEVATPSGTSRATSALGPADPAYKIMAATVTAANVTNPAQVNFTNPTLQFNEGTSVNLWIQYETKANAEFQWVWNVTTGGTTLMTLTANRTEAAASVKTFYMTLLLPLDEASNADKVAEFKVEFKAKGAATVIIEPGGNAVSVDFTIKNVPIIPPPDPIKGGAYMAWEDLLVNSDYDYNDFLAGLSAKEYRRSSDGKLVQVSFTVKAIARGAGYDSDWQFNMDSTFPGANCTAYIQRYTAAGATKGALQTWTSNQGVSIPVFVSNSTTTLPVGANGDGFSTNVYKGSKWVDGDYASVTIVFNTPLTPGTYTPIPFKPQLRVKASANNTYIIGLWSKRGDPVDSNGRPLGFVIPGNYAWMMEGRQIWIGYPRFNTFINWIATGTVNGTNVPNSVLTPTGYNAQGQPIYDPKYDLIDWWNDAPVKTSGSTFNTYQTSLFTGSPKAMPISFPEPN